MGISAEHIPQAKIGNTKNPYQLQNTDPPMNDYCNVYIYRLIYTLQ